MTKSVFDPDHFLHESARIEPIFWQRQAEILRRSSDLVWTAHQRAKRDFDQGNHDDWTLTDIHLDTIGLYLLAAAIENVLKGIAIHRDHQCKVEKFGHKLANLVRLVMPESSDKYGHLLSFLEMILQWRGRYHVPKTATPGWFDQTEESLPINAWSEAVDLYGRLSQILEDALSNEEGLYRVTDFGVAP